MTDNLSELLALAEAATPFWSARESSAGIFRDWEIVQAGGGILMRSTSYGGASADAKFIGTCYPERIKALITELRALRSENAEAREVLTAIKERCLFTDAYEHAMLQAYEWARAFLAKHAASTGVIKWPNNSEVHILKDPPQDPLRSLAAPVSEDKK